MVKKIFNFCLDGSEAESSNSEAEEEEIAEELLHKAGGSKSYHTADQFQQDTQMNISDSRQEHHEGSTWRQ